MLRAVSSGGYPGERVEIAITDVLHRTVFGVHPEVNIHPAGGASPRALDSGAALLELLRQVSAVDTDAPGNRALDALLATGRDVFVERGYHNARVDDLAAAAGVSHGAFYRYFRNKDEIARVLAARAAFAVSTTVTDMPDIAALEGPAGTAVLRRWLLRYHAAHVNEAAMLRVWVDAALQDPSLRAESAPLLDWGRRRMSRAWRRGTSATSTSTQS